MRTILIQYSLLNRDATGLSTKLSGDLRDHPFWSRVAKLDVGSAFWIADPLFVTASGLDASGAAFLSNSISSFVASSLEIRSESDQESAHLQVLGGGIENLSI
jgi:hypothetical protein